MSEGLGGLSGTGSLQRASVTESVQLYISISVSVVPRLLEFTVRTCILKPSKDGDAFLLMWD